MSHLEINGITIPGAADSFEEEPDFIADVDERGANGGMLSSSGGRARTWTATTTPQTAAVGEALRSLIEGEGHAWEFTESLYSFGGLGPSSYSGCSANASGGKHDGRLAITSGNRFEVTFTSRMRRRGGWDPTATGWTVLVWKQLSVGDGGDGTTYHHHIATGDVAVVRGAAANPAGVAQYLDGVAGNASMGNWLSVSAAGLIAVHAYDNAGSAGGYNFSDLVVLPFAMPAAWAPQFFARLNAQRFARLPRIEVSGDAIPDGIVEARGRVPNLKQRNVHLEGAHRNNARVLQLQLREW